MTSQALRYLGQGAIYLVFVVCLGYFADRPALTRFPPDMALLKLSFSHGGQPKAPCRQLSREELARLAPNLRRPTKCERERVALLIELEVDGEVLYRASLEPTGLARDGRSRAYERFIVPPGRHELIARLRDSDRADGFDYEHREEVDLVAQQSLAIDFHSETGGFVFR
jgi:hypothetical protein